MQAYHFSVPHLSPTVPATRSAFRIPLAASARCPGALLAELRAGAALSVLALALVWTLPGTAEAQDETSGPSTAGEPAAGGAEEPFYEIGADDRLRVTVRGEPELSDEYVVRPDGRIALPLAGEIEAVGKVPQALADEIEARLSRFLNDPRATVTVTQATGTFANRIRIIGGALPPRSLPYNTGMTALDAVLAIGGLPETADGNDAYILRRTEDGGTRQIPIRLEDVADGRSPGANRELRPGDTLVVPESFLAGDWQVQPFATGSMTYTDNIDLAPDDQAQDALITEVGPGLTFDANTARLQASGTGRILYQRTSLNQTDNDIRADVSAAATAEWVENLFWTDASASVSQQTVDSSGGTSASVSNDSNTSMTQTYQLSPYLTNRLGRFAFTELRYRGTVTLLEDDDDNNTANERTRLRTNNRASDSLQHELSLTANSGPRFDRYSWTATARATELQLEGGNGDAGIGNDAEQARREVILRNRYAISQSFALIGDIGYQKLDSRDDADSFDAPLYAAGFEWTPSPDTRVLTTYGQRDNNETLELDASHDLSPRTRLTASYQQEVATGQQRLGNRLPRVDQIREGTGPEDDRLSISDETTLTQTARVGAQSRFGRNSFGLTGTYRTVQEDVVDGETNEESIGGEITFSRPLSRTVGFSSFASYQRVDFDGLDGIGGGGTVTDDNYATGFDLSYTGFESISLSAGYTYSRRDSSAANDDYVENAFTISGRINF